MFQLNLPNALTLPPHGRPRRLHRAQPPIGHTFGKVMDPVAGKLMIAAAPISLVSLEKLAAWRAVRTTS